MNTKPIQPSAILALPQANYSEAVRWASRRGYTEIVKLLLTDSRVDPAGVDPSDRDNLAIIVASYWGQAEVVKLLLADSRVDPAARGNEAISQAYRRGYTKVVKLLLADSRVGPAAKNNSTNEA